MKIFISGIIQGSKKERAIHEQSYRDKIKNIVISAYPNAEIICPFELHPNSLSYSFEKGKETFLSMVKVATEVDLLIAYLPEASMGTAIEMWEAWKKGVKIWTISPMSENWVIKFFSERIFPSIDEFEKFIKNDLLK